LREAEGLHFGLLGFGPHRAAHDQIIAHHAPLNKEVIFMGGQRGAYGASPLTLRMRGRAGPHRARSRSMRLLEG
jgi:hypothetical protein